MSKKNFPSEYIQKDNLFETLNFISEFKNFFYQELKKHWWLISIDSPIIEFANNSNSRVINFDNKYNGIIYEISQYPDNYLANFFKKLKNESNYLGLISYVNVFNRDAQIEGTNYLNFPTFDLRIKVEETDRDEFEILVYDYYVKVVEIINKILNELKHQVDPSVVYLIQKTKTINHNKNLINKDNKDVYIKNLVEKYKCLCFINQGSNNQNDFWTMNYPNDDTTYYSEIWSFHPINKNKINLAQINFSKNLGNEVNKEYYLHIVLNINNFLLLFLNKSHLGEIIHGCWDEKTINEAKVKKINLL